jgi:protein-tyrosine-phosphatase
MAHAIAAAEVERRGLAVSVWSAGTWDFEGEWAAIDARLTCERHDTPMPKLLATYLANLDLSDATRVFVMERAHLTQVLAQTNLPALRVCLLGAFDPEKGDEEIADPIGNPAAFESCYIRMRDAIRHYLDTTEDFK